MVWTRVGIITHDIFHHSYVTAIVVLEALVRFMMVFIVLMVLLFVLFCLLQELPVVVEEEVQPTLIRPARRLEECC